MTERTVTWAEPPAGESLRDRKKRLLRRQLSDTATEMFVERGFDAVRVTEIASACGVSEKTVYNHFPTKESLILDRFPVTAAALDAGLADSSVPPVEAAVRILDAELDGFMRWLSAQEDPVAARRRVRRFGDLIRATPSLRAHRREQADRLIARAAAALADRAGLHPDDPEPRIAATALVELWRIQFRSLREHLGADAAPQRVRDAVAADVRRAARVIATGLDTFPQV
jgi:AcrR family transcriptional regulator